MSRNYAHIANPPNWFVPAWMFAFDEKADTLFKRVGLSSVISPSLVSQAEDFLRSFVTWRTKLPYAHVPPCLSPGEFDPAGFGLMAVARLVIPGMGTGYGAYFGELRRGASTEREARLACLKAQAGYYRNVWQPVPIWVDPREGLAPRQTAPARAGGR